MTEKKKSGIIREKGGAEMANGKRTIEEQIAELERTGEKTEGKKVKRGKSQTNKASHRNGRNDLQYPRQRICRR